MAENRERITDWSKRYESKAARRTEAMTTSLPATLRSAGDALRHNHALRDIDHAPDAGHLEARGTKLAEGSTR